MGGSSHASFTFGGILAAGGLAGYVRARSMPSLIGGLAGASAMVGSGLLIQSGSDLEGHGLGATTSALLAGGLGYRAMLKKKWLSPMGVVAAVATLSMAYHCKKVNDWR
mmetsp:Transcript_10726/g.27304  ORF Transcript_10726/g.27304 Transcript_10726/m.27304 type:complete len:109 (+) Transcript_10726:103-429(+)|eukprot:CAMPEP_0197421424 /NCGR_PEP_ID=MMETSP1170-20131217/7019_1 /TAXON_ID=54406 /ORGANISM="Sarcinochrysis sp, Strain CCMP770" /LENGTH=108 /DNA_ID=CAMNT_0042948661 /DNA_START=104 /DNA_END=430 /DNA_ORIENTATION=+